jgi:methylmalonyl-CoA mutase N-terminal domain/subunit
MNTQRRRRSDRVKLKRVYTRADIEGIAHIDSMPGEAPFVRGPFASMYTPKTLDDTPIRGVRAGLRYEPRVSHRAGGRRTGALCRL